MLVALFVLYLINCVACLTNDVREPADECGVMGSSTGLIQGGYVSERETFPWIANIFTKYHGVVLYAGSGSLISDRHILCAANSVAYENYLGDSLDLDPEQNYIAYEGERVKVNLGSNHYKNTNEAGALSIDGALKVVLHPNVAGTKPRVFNVALIFLKEPVAFSNFISPVCLSGVNDDQKKMLGRTLYAVGYGVDSSGSISGVKRHVPMVVLETSICQRFYNETLHKGKASTFFCARGNGVDTPCRYDKPLYIKVNHRWYLQAMSSTFKIFKNKSCRPRAPVLYEDVSSLASWIESEVK